MSEREQRKSVSPGGSEQRVSAAKTFAIKLAQHAAATRCTNVIVLDLHDLSPVCDFFVIATGTSARQMRTVAEEVADLAEQLHFPPLASSGHEGETWVLVDCVDVVFHIFNAATRSYYDLDNLWGDAKTVEWKS